MGLVVRDEYQKTDTGIGWKVGLFVLILVLFHWMEPNPWPRTFEKVKVVFYLATFSYLAYLFVQVVRGQFRPSVLQWYMLFLLLVPVYAGVMAYFRFGQPLFLGVLAERRWFEVVGVLWMLHAINAGKFSREDVYDVLVATSWFVLIVQAGLHFFVDAKSFLGTEFVGYRMARGGHWYRFNLLPIAFGLTHYGLRWCRTMRFRYLAASVLFFVAVLDINKSRGALVFSIVLLIYLVWRERRRFNLLKLALPLGIGIIVLHFLVVTVSPENQPDHAMGFKSISEALATGQSEDPSMNTRVRQFHIIMDWMTSWDRWLFGAGRLSYRWHGGFPGVMDGLYPFDMGWGGTVFQYGLLWAFVFGIQYLICLVPAFALRVWNRSDMDATYVAFLFFLMMYGLQIGLPAYRPALMLFFMVLVLHRKEDWEEIGERIGRFRLRLRMRREGEGSDLG